MDAVMILLIGTLTVGHNIPTGRRPETLEETENLGRNRGTGCAGSAQRGCKRSTLDECTVLAGRREERAALDLFPEIKSGLVPVLCHIAQVIADDGPDEVRGG